VRCIARKADEATKEGLRRGTRSIHAVHKTLPRRRPTEDAGAGHSGGGHPHKPPAEGSKFGVLPAIMPRC
jgi:hypothetical protein